MVEKNKFFYPYSKPLVSSGDIQSVVKVLKSGYLTQGAKLLEFEKKLRRLFKAKYVIACNSGTAALHLVYMALKIDNKKSLLTTPITFAATANAARMCKAKVYFTDVDRDTGLMSLKSLENKLKTYKDIGVISVVHLNGRVMDMEKVSNLAKQYNCLVVEDACHAPGSSFKNKKNFEVITGSCKYSVASTFSFHAIKHITTGEGGCITTNNKKLAEKIKLLRNHGLTKKNNNKWENHMQELGWNYRINEISCALGISQISKLKKGIKKRRKLVKIYKKILTSYNYIQTPELPIFENSHVWHLFPLLIDFKKIKKERLDVMKKLELNGIGTQIHYTPVFLQPYYKNTKNINFPNAMKYYSDTLSMPLYPELTEDNIEYICRKLINILEK